MSRQRQGEADSVADHAMLATLVRFALPIGAAMSLAFTLYAGRHNHSVPLILLFAVWVLSPFVFFFAINGRASRWQRTPQTIIRASTLAITVVALVIYGATALGPHRPRTAFAFLVVPLALWVLGGILTVAGKASVRGGRRSTSA